MFPLSVLLKTAHVNSNQQAEGSRIPVVVMVSQTRKYSLRNDNPY